MIPAKKARWFSSLFAGHARSRIKRTFGRVLVRGATDVSAASRESPLLVVANHSSWWDPLVALFLAERVLGVDAYAMMDATNLRRLPFFGKVGAFGVDLDDPSDGARAIRYASRLLDAPGRALWIYPEGRERSPFADLELRAGAAQIARVAKRAKVVPLAVRYVFRDRERPDLWIAFGEPTGAPRDTNEGVAAQKTGIEGELERIDRALETGDRGDFVLLEEARPGALAGIAEAALAWVTRLF